MPVVRLPANWRQQQPELPEVVTVDGQTARQALRRLTELHPCVGDWLWTEDRLAPTLSIVIDGAIVPRGLYSPLTPTSEIIIVPSIAGG